MKIIFLTVIPCAFFGSYNIGRQAFALLETSQAALSGSRWIWTKSFFERFGLTPDSENIISCFIYGLTWFLPLFLVTVFFVFLVEYWFAKIRKKTMISSFMVTSVVYVLTLPPTLPIWIAVVGIIFGTIFAKEVFGGTGKNFVNPALVGRAFIFFAYPSYLSGNVWVAADGYSGATMLAAASEKGVGEVLWYDAFFGFVSGSIGETSTFLCLIACAILMITKVINWRVIVGIMLGLIFTSGMFNLIGSKTNPMFAITWYWHLVMGGFAFGMVFMATDAASSAMTNLGRIIYGLIIGIMTVLIRVANPAYYEGIMLAILLANVLAPTIDYFVVKSDIKRRKLRYEQ